MNRIFRPLIVLALLSLLLAACGGSSKPSVPSDAVAVVGNDTITKARYAAVLDEARRTYKARHTPFPKPGTQQFTTLRGQIIVYLVQRAEYEQKAKDLGVKVTPADVDKRLDEIKQQTFANPPGKKPATKAEIEKRYRQGLKLQGFTETDVKDGIEYQLLRDKIGQKVTSDVKVSDDEAKKYYDDHKHVYQQPALPESRNVRHILVKKQALALKIYKQLKSGADFTKLVSRYSVDPGSKQTGGRYTICKQQATGCIKTLPAFEKVSFALKPNAISKPVHTKDGWHVIQALGPVVPPKKPKPIPFDQVKAPIKAQLLAQKKQQKMSDWLKNMRDDFAKKTAFQAGYTPPPAVTQTTTTG